MLLGATEAGAAQATELISIPLDSVSFGPEGTTKLLASVDVPADLVGQTCSVIGQADNQESVHPGNDLIITTGDEELVIADFEREGNLVLRADEIETIGRTIEVNIRFGEDRFSSGGFVVSVECDLEEEVPPTTAAPTTIAPPPTAAPTTVAAVTAAPTTEAPTTEAPTTEAPTTEAPTTEAPATAAPTTAAPSVAGAQVTNPPAPTLAPVQPAARPTPAPAAPSPAAAPAPAPAPQSQVGSAAAALPQTGGGADDLALAAASLLFLGGAAVSGARQKRR